MAAESQGPSHALIPQPLHGGKGLADQCQGEIGIRQVLGDSQHIVVELVLGVGLDLNGVKLFFGQVGDQAFNVVKATEGKA